MCIGCVHFFPSQLVCRTFFFLFAQLSEVLVNNNELFVVMNFLKIFGTKKRKKSQDFKVNKPAAKISNQNSTFCVNYPKQKFRESHLKTSSHFCPESGRKKKRNPNIVEAKMLSHVSKNNKTEKKKNDSLKFRC